MVDGIHPNSARYTAVERRRLPTSDGVIMNNAGLRPNSCDR